MLRRVFSKSLLNLHRLKSFVPKCPPPEYDTGCTYCSIPEFPKPIDFNKNLNGTSVVPWKHVLLLTHNQPDFDTMPSKIELIPGINNQFELVKKLASPHHPVMVLNILLKNHEEILKKYDVNNEHLVYLYPDQKVIKFKESDLKDFILNYLVPENIDPVYNPFKKEVEVKEIQQKRVIDQSKFAEYPLSNNLIVICGHTKRDIRCGVLGKMLQDEFERVLEKENINSETGLISHIGGHAYAGNVIMFLDQEPIWYGRVFPDKVQGLVTESIKNGNIIKELYRGEYNS